MAITRVYSVLVIGGAAVISFFLAFIGKLSAFTQSIPTPVMGGVCMIVPSRHLLDNSGIPT